jgi:MoxR-like ATPase
MILLNEDAPRWLRELGRFLNLKSLLFLYGNIHDLVSYPVEESAGGECGWTDSRLRDLLPRLLVDRGYEVVGLGDPAEDLRPAFPEMEKLYRQVMAGAAAPPRPAETAAGKGCTPAGQTAAPAVATPETRARPGRAVDWNRTVDDLARAMQNTEVPCAFVLDLASRFMSRPGTPSEQMLPFFTKLLKASLASKPAVRGNVRWNNLIILVCDKLNDLPAFLYLGNPQARSIRVELPDRGDRRRFIQRQYQEFHRVVQDGVQQPPEAVVADFVDLTEGLTNVELGTLVNLSQKEGLSIVEPVTGASNVRRIIEMYRYGVQVSKWDRVDVSFDDVKKKLGEKVKGQEEAISRVLQIVSRARLGLAAGESHRSQRPRGVLFFAGPTGVGKTQMAKVLAESLLGEESLLIRFDMSEYAAEHADQRLLGAPPRYVGYEEGGQLTDAVKKQPFSILLFDEIDKANGKIFDKFLQILDDGRLTDGKGETAYFSECLIIFTSNLVGPLAALSPDFTTPTFAQLSETIMEAIKDKFNGELKRPEIYNRLGDSFVVFDYIRPPMHVEIVDKLLGELKAAAKEKRRIDLVVSGEAREKLVQFAASRLVHGGRGIRTAVDTALVDPVGLALLRQEAKPPGRAIVEQLNELAAPSKRWEAMVKWEPAAGST